MVSAVADVTGDAPEEMPPLYESIDPEALDSLFAPRADATLRDGSVQFEFAGHPITVRASGEVLVYDD